MFFSFTIVTRALWCKILDFRREACLRLHILQGHRGKHMIRGVKSYLYTGMWIRFPDPGL